ncbi:MAG: hypothetical protein AAFY08_00595 [Planctomycetota bacterium]
MSWEGLGRWLAGPIFGINPEQTTPGIVWVALILQAIPLTALAWSFRQRERRAAFRRAFAPLIEPFLR